MSADHTSGSFQRIIGCLDHVALSDDEFIVLFLFRVVVGHLSFDGFYQVLAFSDFGLDKFIGVDVRRGTSYFLWD